MIGSSDKQINVLTFKLSLVRLIYVFLVGIILVYIFKNYLILMILTNWHIENFQTYKFNWIYMFI